MKYRGYTIERTYAPVPARVGVEYMAYDEEWPDAPALHAGSVEELKAEIDEVLEES